jgi:hypothetical protein
MGDGPMRIVRLLLGLAATVPAHAQAPLATGTPQAAFAGGPIRLSPRAATMLRAQYNGDNVPQVPQPFRSQLDTALVSMDWKRAEAVKKTLVEKAGPVPVLIWEQTRFVATGSIGVAEMHARDVAATGSSGLSETAVMMWLYAVAVTMTDGEKCVDAAARDAHLDRLRGPEFEPVLQIVRTIADDRLAAMRELATRLETTLAEGRTDDTMCRAGTDTPEIKSDAVWRPQAAEVRKMLPKHLQALASVMRPKPVAAAPEAKPKH